MFEPDPISPTCAIRLTCAEAREIDRLALEEYGLAGIVLMENAGAGAARLALARWSLTGTSRVEIACGPGNNGGDGWVVARHLANAGCNVRVTSFAALNALRGDAAVNARAAEHMGIAHHVIVGERDVARALERASARWNDADLVVDALLGTGARGAPRGGIALAIAALEARTLVLAPVLALDAPSGMDADTGTCAGACVRATVTATFAAPKVGFDNAGAADLVGELRVIDIGVPRALLERVTASRVGAPQASLRGADLQREGDRT